MSSLPFHLASSRRYLHRMGKVPCFSQYATGRWFLGSPVDYCKGCSGFSVKFSVDYIQQKKVPKDP